MLDVKVDFVGDDGALGRRSLVRSDRCRAECKERSGYAGSENEKRAGTHNEDVDERVSERAWIRVNFSIFARVQLGSVSLRPTTALKTEVRGSCGHGHRLIGLDV